MAGGDMASCTRSNFTCHLSWSALVSPRVWRSATGCGMWTWQGQGEKAEILGNMERELQRIQSGAYKTAQEIRGRADAEATEIYAGAYNQSADSRRFYEFLKTMETFETTVDPDTWMILSTDGDFYRFLKRSGP